MATKKRSSRRSRPRSRRGNAERRARPFTVEAGRAIYFQGKPFISVNRSGDTRPVEADAVTHSIAAFLNRKGMSPSDLWEERRQGGW